jgi:glucose/arabinose dehydrogenase
MHSQMKRAVSLAGIAAFVAFLGSGRPSARQRSPAARITPVLAQQSQGAAPAVLAPPGINWPAPPLPDGPIPLESAEVRSLRLVVMSKTLNQPWSIAFLPDGAILVTERPGALRIFRNGVLDPNPVAGVPAVRAAGLQGLMDVVLHPRFADNKWIYLSYHKPIGTPVPPARGRGGPVAPEGATTIARGTWDGRALTNVKDIFESGATNTESSRIVFGRDGMLYMTISAPGTGPQVVRSQDPGDYAGKTIRLRDDGTIPADNPFVGKAGYKPGIYTVGHRNGHSFVVNPETGELWATEQGPNGGDEINIIKAGKNYGWPDVSYGRNYLGPRISENPWREGTEQPVVFWVPSIAVTGMTFYTGDRFPAWKRNAFVGGLRQGEVPRTGQINRIVFNDKWEEIRREPMLMSLGQRIRDVRQGPDGLIYIVTSENPGALLRLEPGDATGPTAPTVAR